MHEQSRATTQEPVAGRPRFGIDAPGLVLGFAIGGPLLLAAVLIVGAMLPAASSGNAASSVLGALALTALVFCAEAVAMTLSSRYGKPLLLRRMVASLGFRGDEAVLEVGCGRGMLLLEVARHLPDGRTTGIDLWSTRDQSGNAADATRRNAELAGVAAHVQIDTGDMRRLPYPDASFDAVVASLAIHNLPTSTDREQAVREIARVLKPGGQVALLDFRHTAAYAQTLREEGLTDARRHGPNFLMFPWVWVVHGRK